MLTVVWRMGGCQFSGATQLLPMGATNDQADAAVKSLVESLKGELPTTGHHELKLARDVWSWKEYRTSTKTLLQSIANALKQYLPESWSLAHCKPKNLLAPKGQYGDRVEYLKEELVLRPEMQGMTVHFVHDQKTGMRFPDCYLSEDHYRLVFAADEGTEAHILNNHVVSCNVLFSFQRCFHTIR